MYTIEGVALLDGCGAAAIVFAVATGRIVGEALAVGDALAEADGAADARAARRALEGEAVAVGAYVAVCSGSGVKLGCGVGACTAPPPKNFVNRPPSSNPPRTTNTISGMIGIPPRLGGCGSSLRRLG